MLIIFHVNKLYVHTYVCMYYIQSIQEMVSVIVDKPMKTSVLSLTVVKTNTHHQSISILGCLRIEDYTESVLSLLNRDWHYLDLSGVGHSISGKYLVNEICSKNERTRNM